MKPINGIWRSDFRLSNGERIRLSLKTRDKAEAKHKERALQVEMEEALRKAPSRSVAGTSGGGCGVTLKEAFKRAKVEYEPWRASSSFRTIEDNYGHVAEHFGADMDLTGFTRPTMLSYVATLRDSGKAPSTINQRLSLVSILLKLAEDWTEGKVSPFKMPRQKVRKGRIRVLDYAEEQAAVDWFRGCGKPRASDMADLVVFLVDTGFRLSEALRLRSSEVEWEHGLVPAWETKADHPRMVPMTARVRAIVKAREGLAVPFGMFSVDSADDYWAAMRAGLGIDLETDPEFVIHALRHTCASRLVASGMDAFRVQKWMGHKTIATTQQYVTLFAPDLAALAGALDSRRAEALKSVPKSVPKIASTGAHAGAASRPSAGLRKVPGLLIRRSLVRAQVGEPPNFSCKLDFLSASATTIALHSGCIESLRAIVAKTAKQTRKLQRDF